MGEGEGEGMSRGAAWVFGFWLELLFVFSGFPC